MSTPHSGNSENRASNTRPDQDTACRAAPIEHCLCGLTCFLLAGALLVVLYPALVALSQPLHLLSSTILVVIPLTTWLVAWLGFGLVLEWRADRRMAEP